MIIQNFHALVDLEVLHLRMSLVWLVAQVSAILDLISRLFDNWSILLTRQSASCNFEWLYVLDTLSRKLVSHISNPMVSSQSTRPSARSIHDDKVNVTRILLTGGPCAGKTSALAAISQDLTQLGYKVLIVPEAATLISKGGAFIASSAFTEQQGLLF